MHFNQSLRHHAIVLSAALVVLFTSLGSASLFDEDEPKNAECAREMMARGDWIVPTGNSPLRTDKPILLYWLMIPAYALWGVGEFGARFASAVCGTGTVLVVFHLGRMLFGPRVGLWSGLIMATSLMFVVVARAATPDSTFIFCVTLAMLCYVRAAGLQRAPDSENTPESTTEVRPTIDSLAPRHVGWAVAMYAAIGCGVLAKGPVAIVLPLGVVGLFILCATTAAVTDAAPGRLAWFRRTVWYLARCLAPRRVLRAMWAMRPLLAVAIVGAIALPWYVAVGVRTEGQWLAGFLGHHNVGRFLEPLENHRGPIVYYIPAIIIGFFPWSIFLTLSGIELTRRMRTGTQARQAVLLLFVWMGLWIGFFSLASTKLPNYVLPAYPALAVGTAAFIDRWLAAPQEANRRLVRMALGSLPLVGAGVLVVLPIVTYLLLPGQWILASIGLVPLVGGAVCYWQAERQRVAAAALSCAIVAVVFCVAIFGWAAPRVARHQNAPSLVARAAQETDAAPRMSTYEYFVPSLVFYAQQPVRPLATPAQVAAFFQESGQGYLVTRADKLDELKPLLPAGIDVLEQQRRFLRRGDLVLLGRHSERTAQAAVTTSSH